MLDLPAALVAAIHAEPLAERPWLDLTRWRADNGEDDLSVVVAAHWQLFADTVKHDGRPVAAVLTFKPRDLRLIARKARETEEKALAPPSE